MMPKRKTPPPAPSNARDSEEVFDRWLGRQLAQAYEEVLHEEVPDDLKRLLRAFKDKEAKSDAPDVGQDGEGGQGDASGAEDPAAPKTSDRGETK